MAYKALQNVLLSLQEQGPGPEEGRSRLPQLLSSSRVLQDAGWPDARSRLMQPFSPAPLTDDPTWRLPAPQVPLSDYVLLLFVFNMVGISTKTYRAVPWGRHDLFECNFQHWAP